MVTTYLKNIKHKWIRTQPVYEWEFVEFYNGIGRIYYNKILFKGSGFDFYALIKKDGEWDDIGCEVLALFHGIAYHEGIHNLYFGHYETNNEGYFREPNLGIIKKALKKLRNLEKKHCENCK